MTRNRGDLRRWFHLLGSLWLFSVLAELSQFEAGAAEPDVRRETAVVAVEKVMPSVVNIQTRTLVERRGFFEDVLRGYYGSRRRPADELENLGSGVIIDEAGYVLTNLHVVQRANLIMIKLADGRVYPADPVVNARLADVALLKLRCKPEEKFPAARFAADDDLLLGETVLALGIPFGLGGSVSRGILSSKSRRPPAENEPLDVADWLQTDAAINPGNSGGPLIDLRGEIIGINVAVYSEGQGIGFAIPINRIREAISEVFTPENIKHIWFGATVRAGEFPLRIRALQANSPAAKAGLAVGDTIVAVNGRAPRTFIDFNNALVEIADKKPLELEIERSGQRQRKIVRLQPESAYFNADLIRRKTGITVQALTSELAESLGFTSAEGLVIADVEPESPAAAARLERNLRWLGIDGIPAADIVAVAKHLDARKPGETVVLSIAAERVYGNVIQRRTGEVQLKVR